MMMSDKKPNATTVIIGRLRSKESPELPTPEVPDISAHEAAAEDVLHAMEAKDAKMLAEALKAFYDLCESEEQPEDEMSEGEEY